MVDFPFYIALWTALIKSGIKLEFSIYESIFFVGISHAFDHACSVLDTL